MGKDIFNRHFLKSGLQVFQENLVVGLLGLVWSGRNGREMFPPWKIDEDMTCFHRKVVRLLAKPLSDNMGGAQSVLESRGGSTRESNFE